MRRVGKVAGRRRIIVEQMNKEIGLTGGSLGKYELERCANSKPASGYGGTMLAGD